MTTKAQVADVLTASRVLLAMLLAVAVAAGSFPTATVVLVVAWLTDLLDGRLARAATSPTRLGVWDFRIDVSLGAAFLAGLTLLTGNPAPSMLLLAFAYAWFLWLLLDLRPLFWWFPFASILILLILDWHRFTTVILPAFFRGIATLGHSEGPDGGPVLDRWA